MLGPDATGVGWGFEYALVDRTGKHDLSQLRTLNDWYVQYWLRSVPGVAEVAPVGGYVKQYQIEIDPNALLAYNMPTRHGRGRRCARATTTSAGASSSGPAASTWCAATATSRRSTDIEQISLGAKPDGTPILVKDVARVHLGPDMRRGVAELNGEGDVAGGIVVIRYGVDTYGVIENIKKAVKEKIQPALPKGVEFVTTYDRSDLIERSIETLKEKLIEEAIIVSLVCIVFLWHFRSALVAILTLPLAILLSFVAMRVHRPRLEHHEPRRDRDRDRRDDRRGDHHDRERPQAHRARRGGPGRGARS